MKRMYVVLFLIFLTLFSVGTILAQQIFRSPRDQTTGYENRIKMREEMHRRMIEKLLHGSGPDQDMFKDMEQFMNDAMSDSFSTLSMAPSQNYKIEWKETSTGRILEINPDSPSQQLDINVSNGFVVINGKTETKTPSGSAITNSSNSFNVPSDCDPSKVKMETNNGKIIMQFPYITTKKPETKKTPDNRKPLTPSGQEVQI